MNSLEPPDSFYVEAAKRWLESGDHQLAQKEMARVADEHLFHPDVLEVQWAIEAHARQWLTCLEIAAAIMKTAPERPTGWIKRSYVLHRLKRTREALDNLFPAVERFSEIAIIPYNLACYASRLECWWEAERWLKKSLEVGGTLYREMALREKDLEPLWVRIETGRVPGQL